MAKRLLLKDIASRAGVSISTVSFVLNGKAREQRISEDLIVKVERVIKEADFNPNAMAKGLRTGKTHTIGLIVEDIGNFFFGKVAKTVELTAYSKGYKVLFASTDNDENKARDLLAMMRDQHVDGLIIIPTIGMKSQVVELLLKKTPFVLLDRYFPDIETNYVVLDNYKGSYDLIRLMIEKGHQKIGFITVESEMTQMVERLDGYRHSLLDAGIAYNEKFVLKLPHNVADGIDIARLETFIKSNAQQWDALFFATNYIGIAGLESMRNLGISIPDDLGVGSFDDHDLFKLYQPGISVVAQPIEDLAYTAIELLLSNISSKSSKIRKLKIPPSLIIRDSF